MNKPTRFYSNRQEKAVAVSVNGKKVSNSGATAFNKGDVLTDLFLLECKTCVKEQKSFSIKKEWLIKNKEESFAMRKDYSALVFDFGDGGERYYVIDERLFNILQRLLKEENYDER